VEKIEALIGKQEALKTLKFSCFSMKAFILGFHVTSLFSKIKKNYPFLLPTPWMLFRLPPSLFRVRIQDGARQNTPALQGFSLCNTARLNFQVLAN